jgi:hypothetical protein
MTQPQHRPARQGFIVHAGDIAESAVLPEWWGGLDSDVESRALRFASGGGNWMDEHELPASLVSSGCRLSEVVGVMDFGGLAHPGLAVGRRVLLKPDPQPNDRFAIAVWVEDDSHQVGFLPGNVAAQVMNESVRLSTGFGAFVAREVRDTSSGVRRDVTIFIGPGVIWAEETTEGS